MNFRKLITYLTMGTAAAMPLAVAQNPTILQGSYISNVFGNSNFIKNPNAQTNIADVTVSNATVTRSTTTPLVATSEFLVTVTSANGTIAWNTRTFDQGMKGQNCEARFTYRGFQSTSVAQVRQGATVAGANVVARLALTASTDPRIASINFPCGDLSQPTYFVITDTATLSGTHEIGGAYVGLATNMANVAQAEFVGGGEWTTSTAFTRSSSAIQSTFAAFTSGSAGTAVGKATSAGSDTTITFPYLPAGQYYVSANFYNYLYLGGVNNANCEFTIQEIDSNTNSAISSSGAFSITSIYPPASSLQGNFNFTTGGQRRFRIVSRNVIANGAGSLCASLPDASAKAGIYVYRFPSSSELVVTPERQNVWAGVVYTNSNQALFSTSAEPTAYSSYNNATWNQPTSLKGRASVTTTNSGNDLGFSVADLPVGNYRLEVSGLLNAANNGSTDSVAEVQCNYRLVETDSAGTLRTTVARQGHVDMSVSTNGGEQTRDFTNSFSGVYNNTSVATRNFRIEAQKFSDSTTGNIGLCQAYSNTATNGLNTNLTILMTPLDQPTNSALYVQGPVLGAQTGAAIPAGYVGETYANNSTVDYFAGLNTYASLTLNPGIWMLFGKAAPVDSAGSPASAVDGSCIITTNSAADPTSYFTAWTSQGDYFVFGATDATNGNTRSGNGSNLTVFNLTSQQTVYLRCRLSQSAGTHAGRGSLRAVRLN